MASNVPVEIQEAWLRELRARFIDVARARVAEGAVEDVVQDAMAIIYQKAGSGAGGGMGTPELPWCFQVLRNVVGNHYQRERTRMRGERSGTPLHDGVHEFTARRDNPTPIEALERNERARLLREAIQELAVQDAFCGNHFLEVLGDRERTLAASGPARDGGSGAASTPYVRLFRCREKLRKILTRRGYLP